MVSLDGVLAALRALESVELTDQQRRDLWAAVWPIVSPHPEGEEETEEGPDGTVLVAEIPVDSGCVLVVDPRHVPADLVRQLISPVGRPIALGVLVATPFGQGLYPLVAEPGRLSILDIGYVPGDLMQGEIQQHRPDGGWMSIDYEG